MPRQTDKAKAQPEKAESVGKTTRKTTAETPPEKPKRQRGRNNVTRPTIQEEIAIAHRQRLVFGLAKIGKSFRTIAAHLTNELGIKCSKSQAHKDYTEALSRARERTIDRPAEEFLTMAVDSMFDVLGPAKTRAQRYGRPEDAENVRKTWRELDRYLQFSKSQQSENALADKLKLLLNFDPEAPADGTESNL